MAEYKHKLLITTTETIPGMEITQMLGLVRGNTVQSRNIGRDIFAGLKNIVGGEIKAYTELLATAREEATARMAEQAEARGADAIIAIRYETASIADAAAEVFVYGTAVKIAPKT